jgi:hypothetical protein
MKYITPESMRQYQREERALIATRVKSSKQEIEAILQAMENDYISPLENIDTLRRELARHYKNQKFMSSQNMGQILRVSLQQVLNY